MGFDWKLISIVLFITSVSADTFPNEIINSQVFTHVDEPKFDPPGRDWIIEGSGFDCSKGVQITIFTYIANTTIYYTTDLSIPNTSSILYTDPIELTASTYLWATAYKPGYRKSVSVRQFYAVYEPSFTLDSTLSRQVLIVLMWVIIILVAIALVSIGCLAVRKHNRRPQVTFSSINYDKNHDEYDEHISL